MKVLLVEDDLHIRQGLAEILQREGYAVLEFRGDEVSWRYVDYGWEVEETEEEQEASAGA